MCGVMSTLGSVRKTYSPGGIGSVSCTSSAAPRMRPARNRSTSASLSTSLARAVFTNHAPGFMRVSSARVMMPCDSGV